MVSELQRTPLWTFLLLSHFANKIPQKLKPNFMCVIHTPLRFHIWTFLLKNHVRQVTSATICFSQWLEPLLDQVEANTYHFSVQMFKYCHGSIPWVSLEIPIYKKSENCFESTGVSAKELLGFYSLRTWYLSVPCLQLYNFQLSNGRSVVWFKEAANAEDNTKTVIKKAQPVN